MTDVDIRLGLTPTDLKYREQQVKRPDSWVNLDAENSIEFRLLQQDFGDEIVKSRLFRDEKTIWVKKEKIVAICKLLRDNEETRYNFLSDLTAVDLLRIMAEDEPRFELVYNLYSLKTFQRLRVKAQVTDDDPTIDTVENVWPAANWPEREVFDLFGIKFNNHSDLRRIQMPDDWVGHPLRKDFPLGGEIVEFSFNVRER
ncbi:MAG TPA: NADH-quinone oxidoreductase subunit C [Capsulimonadaceae bacterium]|nr:NADH-quinone oxidoreductase subunit C [Capsulimonadaceae bacterium]